MNSYYSTVLQSEQDSTLRLPQKEPVPREYAWLLSTLLVLSRSLEGVWLKGQSHEIKVWFFGAQWIAKRFLIFPQKGFRSFYQRFHAKFWSWSLPEVPVLHLACTLLMKSTVPITQTVQWNGILVLQKLLVRWTLSLRKVVQSAAHYCQVSPRFPSQFEKKKFSKTQKKFCKVILVFFKGLKKEIF